MERIAFCYLKKRNILIKTFWRLELECLLFSKNTGTKSSGLGRKYPRVFHSQKVSASQKLFFSFFKKRGKAVSLDAKNSNDVFSGLVFVFSTDLANLFFLRLMLSLMSV